MLQITNVKTKCDVRDCKNDSAYFMRTKGRNGMIFLCKECYDKICAEAVARAVPKSPKNTIKKKLEDKENTLYGKN